MLMYRKRLDRRKGLTLMELVVVLMVLVALAGIIVPLLPSMLTRAHVATHTTNVTEITKMVLTYQGLNQGFPDNWDSLTDGTNLITYMAGGVLDPQQVPASPWSAGGAPGAANQAGGVFTAGPVNANEVAALNAAGIIQVQTMVANGGSPWDAQGFDPTFDYYANAPGPGTPIATAGTPLCLIDPVNNTVASAFIQNQYPGWSLTGKYVAFGIGPRSTLVSKMAITAPVHFSDTPSGTSQFSYARYVAIFKVSDGTKPFAMAQFMGAAAIHDVGPTNLDSEFQNWNQINSGGS